MKVNGSSTPLDREQSLYDFLQSRSIDINTIAIELNGEIISKAAYEKIRLNDEDVLEIVHFVGGG